jgi:hypothetical protein
VYDFRVVRGIEARTSEPFLPGTVNLHPVGWTSLLRYEIICGGSTVLKHSLPEAT